MIEREKVRDQQHNKTKDKGKREREREPVAEERRHKMTQKEEDREAIWMQ